MGLTKSTGWRQDNDIYKLTTCRQLMTQHLVILMKMNMSSQAIQEWSLENTVTQESEIRPTQPIYTSWHVTNHTPSLLYPKVQKWNGTFLNWFQDKGQLFEISVAWSIQCPKIAFLKIPPKSAMDEFISTLKAGVWGKFRLSAWWLSAYQGHFHSQFLQIINRFNTSVNSYMHTKPTLP